MRHSKIIIYLIVLASFYNCVQETKPKVITYKLDMTGIDNIENVGVRGNLSPLSWQKSISMSDEDGDRIYETQIKLNSANYNMQFKFVLNDSVFELEGYDNRTIKFDYKPEIIIYRATFDNHKAITISKN